MSPPWRGRQGRASVEQHRDGAVLRGATARQSSGLATGDGVASSDGIAAPPSRGPIVTPPTTAITASTAAVAAKSGRRGVGPSRLGKRTVRPCGTEGTATTPSRGPGRVRLRTLLEPVRNAWIETRIGIVGSGHAGRSPDGAGSVPGVQHSPQLTDRVVERDLAVPTGIPRVSAISVSG